MHVSLIVPSPFTTCSGGYEYDRRMMLGLTSFGHECQVFELPGRFPFADDTARQAALAALEGLLETSHCLIDGLALPGFVGCDDALAAAAVTGLVHHPTSLETGLDADQHDALAAAEAGLFKRLHRVIVTSEATSAALTQHFGVDRARITVVTPGIDDLPRCTGSAGGACEILSIGALIPRKGHDVLLRALGRLFDLNWRLTVVGPEADAGCAAALRSLAGQLGISQRVTFTGELAPAELEECWRQTDLFALATHHEGYGMAVAEALRRGLPVAVTAGGSAASLVAPEAGAVCQPNDHAQLSRALRRLIYGRELRAEMGEVAWRIGQTLPSWATQAERFAAALSL